MTTATWWTLGVAIVACFVACCGMVLASYVSSPQRARRRQLDSDLLNALWGTPRPERLAAMRDRVGEPFTAATDCQKCGVLDIHWIREPRRRPKRTTAEQQFWDSVFVTQSILGGGPMYDPDHIKVVRVCKKCGHTWGQS